MTQSEVRSAKMLPLRMAFNGLAVGAFSLFYLSKHHELNRVRRMKFSIDMIINVGARSALAFLVSDVCTRKLFVNYDGLTKHKTAVNEVKKIMRTYPDARPYLRPHEKPNSYLFV